MLKYRTAAAILAAAVLSISGSSAFAGAAAGAASQIDQAVKQQAQDAAMAANGAGEGSGGLLQRVRTVYVYPAYGWGWPYAYPAPLPAYGPVPPGYRLVYPRRCYANCIVSNGADYCSVNWVNFCPGPLLP